MWRYRDPWPASMPWRQEGPISGRADSNRRLLPPKGSALTRLSYVPPEEVYVALPRSLACLDAVETGRPDLGTGGFEPPASASQRQRSDQAELRPARGSVCGATAILGLPRCRGDRKARSRDGRIRTAGFCLPKAAL